MDAELEKRLDRIEKKLSVLLKQEAESSAMWVKARVVTEITGWNNEKMRQARINGYIKYKDVKEGRFYDLNSLPEIFKVNKVA